MVIAPKDAEAYVKGLRRVHRRWLNRLMHKAKTWIGEETFDTVKPT